MSESQSEGVAEITSKSSRLIDKAKAHYVAQDRIKIEVPEWDVTVYSRPMTFEDSARAMKIRGDKPKQWYPAVVIAMAEDADGKPLFSFTEVKELTEKADQKVVFRIAVAITGDRVTSGDHEGN